LAWFIGPPTLNQSLWIHWPTLCRGKITDSNCVVLGYFNLLGIDWQVMKAASRRDKQFLLACEEVELENFVDFATQMRGNTLDLILSNVSERLLEVR
jgi:hypothetical protein